MSKGRPSEARVVVSSPAGGLEKYRDRAIEAIQRMSMRPIVMEHLVSDHTTPLEASIELIDEADIYVGILAFRYGSYPLGKDRSFTEYELERAEERGIEILIFQMDDNYEGLSAKDVERDPEKLRLLLALKERVSETYVIRKFTSPDNFGYELVASLSRRRREDPRRLHGASIIPPAPTTYVAHPYSLLEARRVVGRQEELGVLTDWIATRESELFDVRVLNVVAIGGMGKSALTWKWFKEVVPNEMTDLAGSVWWSFYESDASFEAFVTRVLAYMTGIEVADLQEQPMKARVELLLSHLDQRPYLLVLDGLERLLNAYAKLDAARMEDSDLDRQTEHGTKNPIGEPSLTKEAIGRHYLRMASDSYAQEFLKRLGSITCSKVLVTTRLFPADMQEDTGNSMAGTRMLELKGLKPADAIELWRGYGNSGSRDNLLNLFESFDYYPLLISALAGLVRDYRPAPGNFDRWLKDNVDFDVFGGERRLVKKRILDFAIAGLEPRSDLVLRVLSAFLMPASYDVLARLLVGRRRQIETEEELHVVLSDLEDRGLVGWDRSTNRYDLHPVVRGMTWARLPKELRRDAHLALRRFFSMQPDPVDDQIKTFDDLAGKVQEYDSLLGLGDFDAAASQFESYLQYYTRFRLKAFRQRRELLVALLRSGDAEVGFEDVEKEMYAWYRLGETDVVMGRCRDAIPSLRKAIAHFQSNKSRWIDGAHYYLGVALAGIGRYRESIQHLVTAAHMRQKLDPAGFGDALRALAEVAYEIRSYKFPKLVEAGLRVLRAAKPGTSDLYALETLKHRVEGDLEAAQQSADKGYASAVRVHLGMGEVASALRQGQVALLREDLDTAEERFALVVRDAREANLFDDEVAAEIGFARSLIGRDELAEAAEHLARARSVLDRHPMVLREVDERNTAARIASLRGGRDEAIRLATEAYRLAWCEGPPYAYNDGLNESRAILKELGAALPRDLEAFSSPMHTELETLDLEDGAEGASPAPKELRPGITDTRGWSEARLNEKLAEVRDGLEWQKTIGSARKWWETFEKENVHRPALVLRLAEELALRKATITEFFLAYAYSNTDNILANLMYLDFTRLKRAEDRLKRKAKAAGGDPVEAGLAAADPEKDVEPDADVLASLGPPGPEITDVDGWAEERVRARIDKVKESIGWGSATGSAQKWWSAFESENAHRPELILRLAEELAGRKSTITEFFLAYVYSNTENIRANLCYLDYTRLKKEEEERKKKLAAAKAAAQPPEPERADPAAGVVEASPSTPELPTGPPEASGVNLAAFETQTWLAPGISSTHGWSEADLRKKLQVLQTRISGQTMLLAKAIANESLRWRRWWFALLDEHEGRLDLVVRLAEELAKRGASIEELHEAKEQSESACILAILARLDYLRSRGQQPQSEADSQVDPAGRLSVASWVQAFPDVGTDPDFVNCPRCQGQTPMGDTCRVCKRQLGGLPAQPLLLAATTRPVGVRNTFDWSDERLESELAELESQRPPIGEAASAWWRSFRAANADNKRHLIRLLEEIRLRGASMDDLHESFVKAKTESLVAILHHLDYSQRLREAG